MDTVSIAQRAIERLGLRYNVDHTSARLVIGLTERDVSGSTSYEIALEAMATRVRLVASYIAGTGGKEGKFDPALAALVAGLAYDLDLHLGVDECDGEIVARLTIDLTYVPKRARVDAATWGLRTFLNQQSTVQRRIREARRIALPLSTLAGKLPVSA